MIFVDLRHVVKEFSKNDVSLLKIDLMECLLQEPNLHAKRC